MSVSRPQHAISTCCRLLAAAGLIVCLDATLNAQENSVLVHAAIRASQLEKHFERSRTERDTISRSLMNSDVTGYQTTVTETRLRILPETNPLQFELINNGTVSSQTTGVNRQAVVESTGHHTFEIIKPFWFDGEKFLTRTSHGTIQATESPQRVISAAGQRAPLLAPMGDQIAWRRVMRLQPRINQVAAENVSRDVLPKVDRIIDADFAEAGRSWTSARRKAARLMAGKTVRWQAASDKASVHLWMESSGAATSGEVTQMTQLRDGEDVALVMTEDSVATLLRDSVPGGMKFSDAQLQKLQAALSAEPQNLTSQLRQILTEASQPTLYSIEFRRTDPVQIRFVDGDIRVHLHFQVYPTIGSPSGWMEATLNFRGQRLSDKEWTVAVRSFDAGDEATSFTVESEAPADSGFTIPGVSDQAEESPSAPESEATTVQAGTVWISMIRAAIQTMVDSADPVRLPLEFPDLTGTFGDSRFRIVRMDSHDGALRVSLRLVEVVPESP